MYSIPSQRRLRWLGHVRRMEDGRTPKDVLYGWLASGSRRVGRPAALRSKDTCKRDMKTCKIDTDCWEDAAGDRARWRQKVKQGIEHADSERGSRRRTKAPSGNSTLLQQPMHSQASSALPASGTSDRGLASAATQDAVAQHQPRSEPLSGAPGIVFRDYALPTNQP